LRRRRRRRIVGEGSVSMASREKTT